MNEIIEQFISWGRRKIFHHFDESKRGLYFREREIWWAALGKNVGYEIDGKHELFERPVLVIKKFSATMCFVLPLTTKIKEGSPAYLFELNVLGKPNAVNLSQGRTISSKRLLDKIIVVDNPQFRAVVNKFISLIKK